MNYDGLDHDKVQGLPLAQQFTAYGVPFNLRTRAVKLISKSQVKPLTAPELQCVQNAYAIAAANYEAEMGDA